MSVLEIVAVERGEPTGRRPRGWSIDWPAAGTQLEIALMDIGGSVVIDDGNRYDGCAIPVRGFLSKRCLAVPIHGTPHGDFALRRKVVSSVGTADQT